MATIAQGFATYINKHKKFVETMKNVENMVNEVEKIEIELDERKREYQKEIQIKNTTQTQLGHFENRLKQQEKLYDRCMGKSIEENGSNDIPSLNEYTDPLVFESKQEQIKKRYELAEKEYYEKRERKILSEEEKLLNEKEEFDNNPTEYVHSSMERISPGSINAIESKKQEVLNYLNANSKIKNADSTQRIQAKLATQTIEQKTCGDSEKRLIEKILSLKGTDEYPTEQSFDLKKFKKYRSKAVDLEDFFTQYSEGFPYQSKVFYPLLGGIAIVLLIVFMLGYTPLFFLIPSTNAVAGAGGAAARMIVRILASGVVALIIFYVVWFVVKLLGSETFGLILGAIAAICMFIKFFTGYLPGITANNMMGFGKVVHFIIALLINLLAVAGIVAILYFIIVNTPIAKLLFKLRDDAVLEGLESFETYFNNNISTYLALFDVDKAVGYTCTNRLTKEISQKEKELGSITEEVDYLGLEAKCEKELKLRVDERNRQVNEVRERIDALRGDIGKSKHSLDETGKTIVSLQREINQLSVKLRTQSDLKDGMLSQIELDKTELKNQTDKIIDKNDEDFIQKCASINTCRELLACKGKLSKQIYFVRNDRDKYGMAELIEVNLKCQHTVFLYEKGDISGNNLSEELAHFIKWYTDAIRRTNPAAILSRWFYVIDVMSGQSVLTMPPFDSIISVIGDEKGKLELAEMLKQKGESVTVEMGRSDIQEGGSRIDNVDMLNAVKMEINKQDIDQQPDMAIQDMWEKLSPYTVVIFIVPGVIDNGAQPSILNDELKKALMNIDHYGIIPVFLVDSETWEDSKRSSDVAYLRNIQNKEVFKVENAGRDNGKLLDIHKN